MQTILSRRAAVIAVLAATAPACGSPPAVAVPAHLSGFQTPESVLYDPARDVYWVSNMGGGGPVAHDGDGFISRVHPDGTIDARFISSDRTGATLDAPKGMALVDGQLHVADIDRVRILDPNTGAPAGEVAIPGAEMLNDVAASPDGTLYVSDTAVDATFTPTGHDAIYRISPEGQAERWLADPGLGNPNGLAVTGDAIWLVTYGTGELLEIAPDGEIRARHAAPLGGLDGIEPIDDRRFLITSWMAEGIYIATADGEFALERDGFESPADLGFDAARQRVLLPLLNAGEVVIDELAAE